MSGADDKVTADTPAPTPRYAKGFRRTPDHKRERLSAPHPGKLASAVTFPPAASLRTNGKQTDQGECSGCVGHATAEAVYVALNAAGTPLPFYPSPCGIYSDARCEEQPGATALDDDGCDPADAIGALARCGVRAIQAPSPDGRFSDVWTAADVAGVPNAPSPNVGLRPTLAEDEASRAELVVGPTLLSPQESDFEDQVCNCIANLRAPLTVGIYATPAFEKWFQSPPPGLAALSDQTDIGDENDGHDVALEDYRTEADGSRSYWLRSSWGEGGDGGGVWVTGAWLRASAMEVWRFQVQLVTLTAQVSEQAAEPGPFDQKAAPVRADHPALEPKRTLMGELVHRIQSNLGNVPKPKRHDDGTGGGT